MKEAESGRSFHFRSLGTSSSPVRRTVSSTLVTPPNSTPNLLRQSKAPCYRKFHTEDIENEVQGARKALLHLHKHFPKLLSVSVYSLSSLAHLSPSLSRPATTLSCPAQSLFCLCPSQPHLCPTWSCTTQPHPAAARLE